MRRLRQLEDKNGKLRRLVGDLSLSQEMQQDFIRDILAEEGVAWAAHGRFTGCHIFVNSRGLSINPRRFDRTALGYHDLRLPRGHGAGQTVGLAMRLFGVDLAPWPGCPASAAHQSSNLDQTLDAFRCSVQLLRAEGELGRAAA